MREIVLATGNENKVREIRQILEGSDFKVCSMKEAGIDCEIIEDGKTFRDNALIKARSVKRFYDGIVIADDSGLSIDYLNGEPGVHSARFMGEDTDYRIKCDKIMEMLDGVEDKDRSARFVCAMAAINEEGREICVEGVIEGIIGHEYVGENGFGYDPIFYVPSFGITTAQMSPKQKNAISHRGKAMKLLQNTLTSGDF